MAYIELGLPKKKENREQIRLICPITIVLSETDRTSTELWYEVDLQFREFLYEDRVDPFVVAMLPYCMKNSLDILVNEKTGISSDLYFQLKEILIPTMSNAKKFCCIELKSVPIWKKLSRGNEIATGISRGVDSFYTLLKTMEGFFKPTYLTLFNTQAYGEYGGTAAEDMFQQDLIIARKLCEEINVFYGTSIKLLTINSNIQKELPIKIYDAGSFRDAGAVILIRQLISLYFFSSTISLEDFTVNGSCREFEPWAFACVSTETQRIQPVGVDKKRLDKVRYISDHPLTYKYLKVCRKPLYCGTEGLQYWNDTNCTYDCEKCRCTILELIAVGKLNKYNEVFDIPWIKEHITELLYEVVRLQKQTGELDYSDIYKEMKENGTIDDAFEIEAGTYFNGVDDAPPDKDYRILDVMNIFFEKVQRGVSIKETIIKLGYQNVGIYGLGRLGKLLCKELEGERILRCVIDRNKDVQYGSVELRVPNEDLSMLDLIIITTVCKEEMIKNYLMLRNTCDVMTLKELLEQSENKAGVQYEKIE